MEKLPSPFEGLNPVDIGKFAKKEGEGGNLHFTEESSRKKDFSNPESAEDAGSLEALVDNFSPEDQAAIDQLLNMHDISRKTLEFIKDPEEVGRLEQLMREYVSAPPENKKAAGKRFADALLDS